MKYLLLIYENPGTRAAFFADERLMAEMNAYVDGLRESGEFVGGEGLADPSTARVVRIQNGVPAVTDGPFMEAKEYFGGYMIVDCDSIERVTEIATETATRFPPSPVGSAVEVRPLMDGGGVED
jgi:hypothetical protein